MSVDTHSYIHTQREKDTHRERQTETETETETERQTEREKEGGREGEKGEKGEGEFEYSYATWHNTHPKSIEYWLLVRGIKHIPMNNIPCNCFPCLLP